MSRPATGRTGALTPEQVEQVPALLAQLVDARAQVLAFERQVVEQARAAGWSWDQIGAATSANGETLRRRFKGSVS
jgi:hypothetical protein